MLKRKSHDNVKIAVEMEVIKTIEDQGCNLNTVNNDGENLLHVSAANGCYEIVKKILEWEKSCLIIDRKNKFGWTSLMQAIRNGDIDTVKLLLEKKSNVNESTYLGMSVLGLAAAISKEMFETVYNAYPNALTNAASDDISPLCVAAMKNDKELFFKLLKLGTPLSSANEYTQITMRNSTVPEIACLAKEHLIIEDYWNDTSDNIQVINEQDMSDTVDKNGLIYNTIKDCSKRISANDEEKKKKPTNLHLLAVPEIFQEQNTSLYLTYNYNETFSSSPMRLNTINDPLKRLIALSRDKNENKEITEDDLKKYLAMDGNQLESKFTTPPKSQSVQPADLDIMNRSNVSLGFTPEFSPIRSPYVPPDINEENVFGENTPTPPRCRTPPKGILLNSRQSKLVIALRYFGLSQHIPIFLEQEVDIDLFVTLTYNDLLEIGIEKEEDRYALLDAVKKYNRDLKYMNNIFIN